MVVVWKIDAPEARTPQTEPIDFTAALHTYVEVADASMPEVFVRGLSGKTYLDKAGGRWYDFTSAFAR